MMLPMFALYAHVGDSIPHPTRETAGRITSVNHVPPSKTPGRPWGVVSGWMSNPENPSELWAWTYPADTLLIIQRASRN